MAVTRSTASAFPVITAASTTVSVTLGNQGDLVIVTMDTGGAVLPTVSDSLSAITWSTAVNGQFSSYSSTTAIGTVTAAAAGQTVTLTVTGGGTPDYIVVDELISGLGINTVWALSNTLSTNYGGSSNASAEFPSLATGSSGTLAYHGTVWGANAVSGGTTPVNGAAFTYNSSSFVGVAFSGAVAASTTYAPTATMASGTQASNGITLSASTSGGGSPSSVGLLMSLL